MGNSEGLEKIFEEYKENHNLTDKDLEKLRDERLSESESNFINSPPVGRELF